ncbi:MAG: type II toxin-antitoxin system VapB family antitoxin [Homoserinimonas sp.]
MGLNLKDEETVALVTEVAKRLHTTKTGAVRELARQKLSELEAVESDDVQARHEELIRFLETDIWPHTAGESITKGEIEELLGYNEMFPQ